MWAVSVGLLAAGARSAGGIDDPAHWRAGRAKLASLGEGIIAWETNREGRWRIYATRLAGGTPYRLSIDDGEYEHYAPHISPDGRRLAYVRMTRGSSMYGKIRGKVQLRLIDLPGGADRAVVDSVKLVSGGDRAVTWIDAGSFYYMDGEGRARRYDLETGTSGEPVLPRARSLLPNPTGTYAADRYHYHPMDLARRKLTGRGKRHGGCEPYFSQDGTWGIRMSGAGGPITRIHLHSGRAEPIIEKHDPRLPRARRYLYFPMLSPCQRLLAFGASPKQHDHNNSDYDIFVGPLDPESLRFSGGAVRITFHPKTDRYPTVWLSSLDFLEQRGEAPFTATFTHDDVKRPGDWAWDYGDGSRGRKGSHLYRKAGSYRVTATRDRRKLKGRVTVRPPRPPKPLSVFLAGKNEVHIVFDEPIDARTARVTLGCGARVERLAAEGETLIVKLATRPPNPDTVGIVGVRDRSQSRHAMAPASLELRRAVWPTTREGLVFVFDSAKARNRLDSPDGEWEPKLAPVGRGRLDRHHAMVVDDGAFAVGELAERRLLERLKRSNALTIEALVTPRSPDQSGPARIVSFSRNPSSRNFTLGQQGGKLNMRLRTPRTGGNGTNPSVDLFPIVAGKAVHVVVTYHEGQLTAYRNGEVALRSKAVTGDFANWEAMHLVFGDEHSGGRNWDGSVESVAIYDRPLTPEEVARHWRAVRVKLARREAVPRTRVEARVVRASQAPKLADIAPYREALIVHEVEVTGGAGEGELARGRRVFVADWAILDGKTQPGARAKAGQKLDVTLEPFAAQPQLESTYLAETLEMDLDAPLYYNVGR